VRVKGLADQRKETVPGLHGAGVGADRADWAIVRDAEFQRGVLTQDATGSWSVAVTGEQGSGILRSMCEANCFIILPTDQGNVAAGALVDVQVMDGIV
jgi:molybdopterin biosynthesis enzyme